MMEAKGQSVLDAALGLPEAERALIAERLLATLSTDEEPHGEEELAEELERRFAEGRDDPSATISWADLRDE